MVVTLVPIDPHDPDLRAALRAAGLPIEDLEAPGVRLFAARSDGTTIGWGGLEGEGPDRLLRSLVVPAHARGKGGGRAILAALEAEARRAGAARLWLLTTSAAAFFAAAGWRRADRAEAPRAIAATSQFAGLCPAAATFMERDLRAA